MSALAILEEARSLNVSLRVEGDRIKAKGSRPAVERLLPALRQHKPELLTALTQLFHWSPLDPASSKEILEERIGILMDAGLPEADALQEASWQVEQARCWERFQRHARIILEASGQDREALLEQYAQAAASSFGQRIASHMADTMRSWVAARTGG